MEKIYFIYIISNKKNGTLYIGMTNNLARRMYEHKNKLIEGFSKKYDVCKLIHYEIFNDPSSAIHREKLLKNWNREWKIKLIEKNNPEWRDLCSELGF